MCYDPFSKKCSPTFQISHPNPGIDTSPTKKSAWFFFAFCNPTFETKHKIHQKTPNRNWSESQLFPVPKMESFSNLLDFALKRFHFNFKEPKIQIQCQFLSSFFSLHVPMGFSYIAQLQLFQMRATWWLLLPVPVDWLGGGKFLSLIFYIIRYSQISSGNTRSVIFKQ